MVVILSMWWQLLFHYLIQGLNSQPLDNSNTCITNAYIIRFKRLHRLYHVPNKEYESTILLLYWSLKPLPEFWEVEKNEICDQMTQNWFMGHSTGLAVRSHNFTIENATKFYANSFFLMHFLLVELSSCSSCQVQS